MAYPSRADYSQAVGSFPQVSIIDATLRSGTPARGSNNLLLVYSGGFSSVFPLVVGPNTFALRCWVRDIGDAEIRYQGISNYLKQKNLPYFVEFAYIREGILVNGTKWPITRMEWAEGETLCQFIENNLHDAALLRTTAAEFLNMVETLHTHQISHGDLQDGNILLKRNNTDVEIKLIDYDSVFVPALRGFPDSIVGLPQYQHPSRTAGGGIANEKVDYFSELVIYLSLLAVAEKPALWSQFKGGMDGALLFVATDFRNPAQSSIFQELESLSSDVKLLASKLKQFCAKTSIDQLEPLEMLLPRTDPAAKKACDQGLIFLHSKRYNEAIAEFEKAIRIDSSYKEAHHRLGLAYLKIGNLASAKRQAEDTLKIDANYQPALQLLDTVRQMLRNIKPNRSASKPSGTPSRSQSASVNRSTIKQFFGGLMTFFQSRRHYFNHRTLISVGAVFLLAIVLLVRSPWQDCSQINGETKIKGPNGAGGPTKTTEGNGRDSPKTTQTGTGSDDEGTTPRGSDQDKVIPSENSEETEPDGDPLRESQVVNVSINAVPWAKVSIELPEKTGFIKPRKEYYDLPADSSEEISNITPIPGGLRVPIGTTIMLEYGDRKMTFSYNSWKTSKTISHDFLKP